MSVDALAFGSPLYWRMAGLVLFGRAADLFSTKVATPNLVLEGNPLAKWLGWKAGTLLNLPLCVLFAFWPTVALAAATASLLVAAHNFHVAWLMRSMGEEAYRDWFVQRVMDCRLPLHLLCLFGETGMTALVGGALMYWYREDTKAYSVGAGIVMYSVIVLFYTSLSLWRLRKAIGT